MLSHFYGEMTWRPELGDAAAPLHVQIRRSISDAVTQGQLQPGEQLDGVRTLAERLGVNRLTVLKAVRSLSRAGVLETVPGKGVFVSRQPLGPRLEDHRGPKRFFEGAAEGPALEPREIEQLSDGIMATLRDGLAADNISFSVGFPPPEALPVELVRRTLMGLLRSQEAPRLLGYAATQGDPELCRVLAEWLEQRGFPLPEGHRILVTSGAQHGLALCLDALLGLGQALALESPGYLGAIAACRQRGIPMVSVPVDEGGLNPARLESALGHHDVGALYTMPSFHNPTGVSQSRRRRRRLLELCRRHGTLVIEDDIYADLYFGGRRPPPLASLSPTTPVIHLGSLSKSFSPGLRVGFIVAPEPWATALRRQKESTDISTGTVVQALATEILRTGAYRRHLARIRRLYRQRRDAMVAALERYLPRSYRFTRPLGGMHLWVMPDQSFDATRLLARARQAGVTFAPGALFFADGRRSSAFRLNFSSHPPERIEEGIRRLADCIAEEGS